MLFLKEEGDNFHKYPCDSSEVINKDEMVIECPKCGAKIDKDGRAFFTCPFSRVVCEICGSRPCDGSC